MMIRCDSCGFENPAGALVCRNCRRRLRARADVSGPRRETEEELTVVVARELGRLAMMIAGILLLGTLVAFPLYHRVEPALLVLAAVAAGLGVLARRQSHREAAGPASV